MAWATRDLISKTQTKQTKKTSTVLYYTLIFKFYVYGCLACMVFVPCAYLVLEEARRHQISLDWS